jgi:hypothetical protein
VIAELSFEPLGAGAHGKLVRRAAFVRRAGVPLARAFAFGRLAQEKLSHLLGRDAAVRITDPVAVEPHSAGVIFDGAIVVEAVGADANLYAVVRESDARRIVALAYGEDETRAGGLSPLEVRVVERLASDICALAYPLCGDIGSVRRVRQDPAAYACAAYFELLVDGARVGIALSAEIAPRVERRLTPAALGGVGLEVEARFARGSLTASALGRLAVGDVLRFETRVHEPAALVVGGTPLAHGVCGHHGRVAAFTVHDVTHARDHAAE